MAFIIFFKQGEAMSSEEQGEAEEEETTTPVPTHVNVLIPSEAKSGTKMLVRLEGGRSIEVTVRNLRPDQFDLF
jgi:hypothetical protein